MLGVLCRLDEHDRLGSLAERPLDLLVALVSNQDDRVAGVGIAAGLGMHLRHERACRVDRREPQLLRFPAHRRRDAVGREHDGRPLRHVGEGVDEDSAARPQILHHVRVVDDLLADVNRRAVEREGAFDRLHCPLDARAIASR